MEKYYFFIFFLFINVRISTESSITKDNYDEHENKKNILNYKYDYCDIDNSRLAVFIIEEMRKYINERNYGLINQIDTNFSKNKRSCLLINDNLIEYVNYFDEIEESNKSSYGTFKCTKCLKKFKTKEFLYLHYKLFHLSSELKQNASWELKQLNLGDMKKEDLLCPAELCIILNCKRYKNYLNLNKEEKKILNYKNIECNPFLESYYRKMCMELLNNCFINKKDQFTFYKFFCESERCEPNNDEAIINNLFEINNYKNKISTLKRHQNLFSELPKEGTLFSIFFSILLYLVSILSFIYIIIVWVTKNN